MSNKNMHQIMESIQAMTQMEEAPVYSAYDPKEDKRLQGIIHRYPHEVEQLLQSGDFDNDLYSALYDYYTSGDSPKKMPYGTQTARDGDPYEWIYQEFSDAMDSLNASPYQAYNPAGSLQEAMDLVTNEGNYHDADFVNKSERLERLRALAKRQGDRESFEKYDAEIKKLYGSDVSTPDGTFDESFDAKINPAKKGMFDGKTKEELLKQYRKLKASGPHEKGSDAYTKMKELGFAIRAKSGWGKVAEEQVDEGISSIVDFFAKKYQDYSREEVFQGLQKVKQEIGDIDTDAATNMVLGMILGKQQPQAAFAEDMDQAKQQKMNDLATAAKNFKLPPSGKVAECDEEEVQIQVQPEQETMSQERNPLDAIVALANIKPVSIVQRAIDMEEQAGVITPKQYDQGLAEDGALSDAARELVMFGDNDSQLYNTSYMPIINNLTKKVSKGTYDSELAKKLWKYHADRAAQRYAQEHGDGTPWQRMFTPDDRRAAAAEWEAAAREEIGADSVAEGIDDDASYWDFKDLKDEPTSGTRKVAGRAYGGSAQPYDDEEEEEVSVVKRGRGRPAGTGKKTGARGPRVGKLREGEDAVDVYDEYLDSSYPTYKIEGVELYPSQILRNCDSVAYRIGSNDYIESELGDSYDDELQESAVSKVLRHASFLTEGKVKADTRKKISESGFYVIGPKGQSVSYHKDKSSAEKEAKQLNQRGGGSYKVEQDIKESGERQLKKIVKGKNGGMIGEIGIDNEAEPGVGPWYFAHYSSGERLNGFDSEEDAMNELQYYQNLQDKGYSESKLNELSPLKTRLYKQAAVRDADRHRNASDRAALRGADWESEEHGKMFDKRVKGISAANRSLERKGRPQELDELSPDTLKSYATKAKRDSKKRMSAALQGDTLDTAGIKKAQDRFVKATKAKDLADKRWARDFKEDAKPDFLDLDKDGNKKEPMKKAVKQVKETASEGDDMIKLAKVIASCTTKEQLAAAKKMAANFLAKHSEDFGSIGDMFNAKNFHKDVARAKAVNRDIDAKAATLSEKSVSQSQARMMAGAAHDKDFAKKVGVKQSVAKEFNKADKGTKISKLPKHVDEESTDKRDNRAEKAGKKVTKDLEYDMKHKGKDDKKAERAGKKVTKDIEYDEKKKKVKETTCAGSVAPAAGGAEPAGADKYGFGKGIYESMDFNKAFSKEMKKQQLNEGLSININVDNSGQKSINVSATDEDADHLAQILKMAGMGGMSMNESQVCETCGEQQCECAMMENDELANGADDTEVANTDTLVNQFSGGLNGRQKQINPNNRGDNPMSMKGLDNKAVDLSLDLSESANSLIALINKMKK